MSPTLSSLTLWASIGIAWLAAGVGVTLLLRSHYACDARWDDAVGAVGADPEEPGVGGEPAGGPRVEDVWDGP